MTEISKVNIEAEDHEGPNGAETAVPEVAAPKEVKTEESVPAPDATPAAEDLGDGEQEDFVDEDEEEAGENEEVEPGGDKAAIEADSPGDENAGNKRKECSRSVTLGYKTFTNSAEAVQYFKQLMYTYPLDTDMNEYEYRAVLDLVQQGHPSAASKIGCGVRAFQVRFYGQETDCRAYYAIRKDGTLEDFSYIKCLGEIYPEEVNLKRTKRTDPGGHESWGHGGRRGGRGGRRGWGGRGRRGGRGGGGHRGGGRRGGRN